MGLTREHPHRVEDCVLGRGKSNTFWLGADRKQECPKIARNWAAALANSALDQVSPMGVGQLCLPHTYHNDANTAEI